MDTIPPVLVIDDSRAMRRVVVDVLREVGYTDVVEAADGDEALRDFARHDFGLVVTDWNMPGKNGLEVVRAIRASGSKVPIIMVSTQSEKKRVFQAIQAGVTDYVVKPFVPATLSAKVEKHLPASRPTGCESAVQ